MKRNFTGVRQYTGPTTPGAVLFGAGCLLFFAVLAIFAAYVAMLGVVGFHLYRAYHPAAWPYIGQWEWLGIATVFALFVRPVKFSIGSH